MKIFHQVVCKSGAYTNCRTVNMDEQEVISERLEGIKREYGELDTVWFMAGSLFKVCL
jgi:hypothetical protein